MDKSELLPFIHTELILVKYSTEIQYNNKK